MSFQAPLFLTALLIAAAVPYAWIEVGTPGLSQYPHHLQSVQAFEVLDSDFSAGRLDPAEIAVEGDMNSPEMRNAITRLEELVTAEAGRRVAAGVRRTLPSSTIYGFNGTFHTVRDNEFILQTFEFEGAPGHVSLETLTFEEHDDTTVIRANSVYQSVADRDAMIASTQSIINSHGMVPYEVELIEFI